MSKIRIYIQPKDISDFIELRDKNLVHKIRNVLRLKKKDSLYVFDGRGKEWLYRIEAIAKKSVSIKRESFSKSSPASDRRIILGFPLAKEDKIDFILQKATELGVEGFIPFACERSLEVKVTDKKLERWKRIIVGALGQSERLWMPSLKGVLDFQEITNVSYKVKLAASVKGEKVSSILNGQEEEVFVLVGPEGGFSHSEYNQLEQRNFKSLKLSSHILRVETACMFSVGLINYGDGFLLKGRP